MSEQRLKNSLNNLNTVLAMASEQQEPPLASTASAAAVTSASASTAAPTTTATTSSSSSGIDKAPATEMVSSTNSDAASDYSLFTLSENGHLSFENPNYQLQRGDLAALVAGDPSRLDDHLNSNVQPSIPVSVYEELKHELDKFEGSAATTSTGGLNR